jgi:hypothetical protein
MAIIGSVAPEFYKLVSIILHGSSFSSRLFSVDIEYKV